MKVIVTEIVDGVFPDDRSSAFFCLLVAFAAIDGSLPLDYWTKIILGCIILICS